MALKKFLRAAAFIAAVIFSANSFAGNETAAPATTSGTNSAIQQTTPNSHDLISIQTMYTGMSNISGILARGRQDATYEDFSYAHRFTITGNWDIRLGVEYQRYDFTGAMAPLPDHLQNFNATVAYEYVQQDFPAVAVEFHPGFSFENNVTGRNFDVPMDAFTSMKLYKDKVFGIAGVEYDNFIWPGVSGFGGVIWLINDQWRLQAIMPRPALIYSPNDDWEFQLKAQIYGGGFRLDSSGRTPTTYQGAIVRYTYDQVGLEATYKKWKPLSITFDAGYNIQREFDFIHYGPDQKYTSSGAPFVGITFGVNF
ncbi:MAG TPA: hypothetical protein VG733_13235 [Chthoniobacteraceae bacterium]|nr:hypothetical protein [Chthoniobacteraceae bacterium]